jgi:hypothetical protein
MIGLWLPGVAIRLERLLGVFLVWVPWILLSGTLLLNGHDVLPEGSQQQLGESCI